ncbi:MAG TPA: carbohydrate kinase, partial [Bacteroidales bacterium]
IIRAGNANMFLSTIFRSTLANVTGATIELYDTDGAQGAAKGAGVGSGVYKSFGEAFSSLKKLAVIEPNKSEQKASLEAYENWKIVLEKNV